MQIVRIEGAYLTGQRPRKAGSNARLGEHGSALRIPCVRITTADGLSGFGFCLLRPEQARELLGLRLEALFTPGHGVMERGLPFEFPLWDLAGQATGAPVYALAAAVAGTAPPDSLQVPAYDTSLYFDDLHLDSDQAAAELLAEQAQEGYARGHRAFKIKVGRGALHLPPEAGTRRDIAVVQAVRQAIGPGLPLMLDANNGYTLNLAKRVLQETAACEIYWIEEAFHEDAVLYRNLKAWMQQEDLTVRIADGEGDASPNLMEWARTHVIDVVQYDIFHPGFTRWLALGRQLDAWGARSAPHHYGGFFGNFVSCHLAPAIQGFTVVEWDEAALPGIDTSGYTLHSGRV